MWQIVEKYDCGFSTIIDVDNCKKKPKNFRLACSANVYTRELIWTRLTTKPANNNNTSTVYIYILVPGLKNSNVIL